LDPGLFDIAWLSLLEEALVGLLILFHGLCLIEAVQMVPVLGPTLLAVILTLVHQEVLLYMAVVLAFLLVIAGGGVILMGTYVKGFQGVVQAFFRLFFLIFADFKDINLDSSSPEVVRDKLLITILYLVVIIFGITFLNLLIGLVTDLYPAIRDDSLSRWEDNITQQMTRHMVDRKFKHIYDLHTYKNDPSSIQDIFHGVDGEFRSEGVGWRARDCRIFKCVYFEYAPRYTSEYGYRCTDMCTCT